MSWIQFSNKNIECDLAIKNDADKYDYIYVECAKFIDAANTFHNNFGFDPESICDECGEHHFDVWPWDTIGQATAKARGCYYDEGTGYFLEMPANPDEEESYITLDEFKKLEWILFIAIDKKYAGQFCVQCYNWSAMSEPNEGDKFRCWRCRNYPY